MNHFLVVGSLLGFIILALLSFLGWQLLRQNGRMLLRLDELEKRFDESEFGGAEQAAGLPLDTVAPEFELPDLAGRRHTLAEFSGQPRLLIFFNPACGFCRELAPKLAALNSKSRKQKPESDSGPDIVAATGPVPLPLIISTGGAEANRKLFNEHKVTCPVLLQEGTEVATAYQANGTPSGYLISEGKITSELALGAEALLALAEGKAESRKQKTEIEPDSSSASTGDRQARENRFHERSLARSKLKRDGLKAGSPAPNFRLPRVDGRGDIALEDWRGRPILLVFSSPTCGPCLSLAPQLEQFYRNHPKLGVVMISKGDPKANRAKVKEHGLTFPVLLQQQWEISRLYAMFATPIAYLISEKGIISNDVAVGTDAILRLMAVAVQTQELPLAIRGP